MTDTIFALATAPGRAAVAILRLSGPQSAATVQALAGPLPPARHASVRRLKDDAGEVLDEAVVLWLPGPHSYTGEDSAELHLHGGPAIVDAVSTVLQVAGCRPAEPGEFTRRAFENGRMDLAQAEAVADLVEAETQAQRRQALDQLGGALGRRHEAWRELITRALAVLEAAIDFPDEDLPLDVARAATPLLQGLRDEIAAALDDAERGERVREGFRVAIIGAPNAGKSSLLNRLSGRDAAIVTPEPGTTRDVIEIPLVLAGYKLLLADTAGLRDAQNPIEAEGVRRARNWAQKADLRLWVVDSSGVHGAWREGSTLLEAGDLLVLNKSDLPAGADMGAALERSVAASLQDVFQVSLVSAEGLFELRVALEQAVVGALGGGFPAGTRLRHRSRLQDAIARLDRALAAVAIAPELAAEDVRLAGRSLEEVTGRIGAEAVLGEVFSAFCIGK